MSKHIDLRRSVIVEKASDPLTVWCHSFINALKSFMMPHCVVSRPTYVVDKLESGSSRNVIWVLQRGMKSVSTRIHVNKGKCVKYWWGLSHCVKAKMHPYNVVPDPHYVNKIAIDARTWQHTSLFPLCCTGLNYKLAAE